MRTIFSPNSSASGDAVAPKIACPEAARRAGARLAARDAMGGGAFAKERYYEDQILWHYDVDREGVRTRLARGVKTV